MANIDNPSRYQVTVKNRDGLTKKFPLDKFEVVEAYMALLRQQGFKPRAQQEESRFLVRIRQKGYAKLEVTLASLAEAEAFVKKVEEERSRGLFINYTKSNQVSFADLMIRYLLEEAPKHKSCQMLACKIEGWLEATPAKAGGCRVSLAVLWLGNPFRFYHWRRRRALMLRLALTAQAQGRLPTMPA